MVRVEIGFDRVGVGLRAHVVRTVARDVVRCVGGRVEHSGHLLGHFLRHLLDLLAEHLVRVRAMVRARARVRFMV